MLVDARTELVIAADIAARLGISRARVSVLSRRADFPLPGGRDVHRAGDRGRAGAVHRQGRRARRRVTEGGEMTAVKTTSHRIRDARSALWFGRWPGGWGDVVQGVAPGAGSSAAAMIDAAA